MIDMHDWGVNDGGPANQPSGSDEAFRENTQEFARTRIERSVLEADRVQTMASHQLQHGRLVMARQVGSHQAATMLIQGDCLSGLKFRFFPSPQTRIFFVSTGLGVGRVRHWLRLKVFAPSPACEGRPNYQEEFTGTYCYVRDTVRNRWAHNGAGAGGAFALVGSLSFVVDTYVMLILADTSLTLD